MIRAVFSLVSLALVVAACGGGEPLVVNDTERSRQPLPEPSSGSPASAWSSSNEYRSANGLRLMKAAEGYAVRSTGSSGGDGKTVAVLDTPLDTSHLDLDGRTLNFALDNPDFRDDNIAHGTHVSGTVAARRDGEGVHGVAYNSNLVGIGVLRAVQRQRLFVSPIADVPSDVAAGIASAAGLDREYAVYDQFGNVVYQRDAFGYPILDLFGYPIPELKASNPQGRADVMNMSLGSPDSQGQILSAMREAATAGKIIVAALGNCGQPFSNPQCQQLRDYDGLGPTSAPARYVTDRGIAGTAIAVGALDTSGTGRASFSNACGEARNYCLFAPGSDIYSTVPGNGYEAMSGTSMASPHVAGAAAVVWAAFPKKSARDIVSRLLRTARPIDGYELSSEFGHGVLDLEAALGPYGQLTMTVSEGGTLPLANTVLQLPLGFSTPSQTMNLAEAIVYDEQAFPFLYDLNSAFYADPGRTEDIFSRWFLSTLGQQSTLVSAGTRASAHFVHGDTDEANIGPSSVGYGTELSLTAARLNVAPAADLRITFGSMSDPSGFTNRAVLERTRSTVLNDGLAASPFATLVGTGVGMEAGWQWDRNSVLDVVAMKGHGYFGSSSAQLTSIGLTHYMGSNVIVGTRYGTLLERGSRMGVRAEGALGGIVNAMTHFLDLSVEGQISADTALFGATSHGMADSLSPDGASLVSDWSFVRGESFTVGSETRNLWSASDHLILTASLPFRARNARLTIDIPDREIADGILRYTSHSVNLTPRGREKRLQFVYGRDVHDGVKFTAGGYVRIEPNHDSEAETEFGGAAKINVLF